QSYEHRLIQRCHQLTESSIARRIEPSRSGRMAGASSEYVRENCATSPCFSAKDVVARSPWLTRGTLLRNQYAPLPISTRNPRLPTARTLTGAEPSLRRGWNSTLISTCPSVQRNSRIN